jgi:hypothetical protein
MSLFTGISPNLGILHDGVGVKSVYDSATKVSIILPLLAPSYTGYQIPLEQLRELVGQATRLDVAYGDVLQELLSPSSAEYAPHFGNHS